MKKMTLEQSLESIAMSISNVTELGQYINVSSDVETTDVSGIEDRLDSLNESFLEITNELSNLRDIRDSLESISESLTIIANSLKK